MCKTVSLQTEGNDVTQLIVFMGIFVRIDKDNLVQ